MILRNILIWVMYLWNKYVWELIFNKFRGSKTKLSVRDGYRSLDQFCWDFLLLHSSIYKLPHKFPVAKSLPSRFYGGRYFYSIWPPSLARGPHSRGGQHKLLIFWQHISVTTEAHGSQPYHPPAPPPPPPTVPPSVKGVQVRFSWFLFLPR